MLINYRQLNIHPFSFGQNTRKSHFSNSKAAISRKILVQSLSTVDSIFYCNVEMLIFLKIFFQVLQRKGFEDPESITEQKQLLWKENCTDHCSNA